MLPYLEIIKLFLLAVIIVLQFLTVRCVFRHHESVIRARRAAEKENRSLRQQLGLPIESNDNDNDID